MKVIEKLELLRSKMREENIDAYMIPSSDPHLSEYVADYYKTRAFMSGFTGSAGTLIVTLDGAFLWADGRYFIQAERELADSTITLHKMGQPGVPKITEWINDISNEKYVIGYNDQLFSYEGLRRIKKAVKNKMIGYKPTKDLVDGFWNDRPGLPSDKLFHHGIEFTGLSAKEKVDNIRKKMEKEDVEYYILSSLNDIAWLFNIRGNDVLYTPVVYAYACITSQDAYFFVDEEKVDEENRAILEGNNIAIKPYGEFYTYLNDLDGDKRIAFDPMKVNEAMVNCVAEKMELVEIKDFTLMEKSIMNPTEIKNYYNCNVKDGLAMVKFLSWLDEEVAKGITEFDAMTRLTAFRADQENYIEDSFNTIAAYGGNAAMMHYSTDPNNSPMLEARGLFLLDSGGQYIDGTTDITRTIALGELTEEERNDFTLVLKGNIGLSKAVFLEGCTGSHLDVLARRPIWQAAMDYKCGTGHSVGYVLGVHEGPQRIAGAVNDVVLKPGMIITNEPGIYKEDKHGIRIENILLVKEMETNEMGTFYCFEALTLCPIDLRAINKDLLAQEEIVWLNDYHQNVYNKLKNHLGEKELTWLENATREI